MSSFNIIVAMDAHRGIGKNNAIPWKLPTDMSYFRQITTTTKLPGKQNAVIMGRKTWESLPPAFSPLKNRLNIVLTRNPRLTLPDSVLRASTLEEGLELTKHHQTPDCFVIGGAAIYEEAILSPSLKTIYMTQLDQTFGCDRFFPALPSHFKCQTKSQPIEENGLQFYFEIYTKTEKEDL